MLNPKVLILLIGFLAILFLLRGPTDTVGKAFAIPGTHDSFSSVHCTLAAGHLITLPISACADAINAYSCCNTYLTRKAVEARFVAKMPERSP